LTESEKRELVRRVLGSPAFSGANAVSAFLLYVTEHALSGSAEKIKEQRIGSEVLGRKRDYDPAADNIVRVRAHELRQKLAKYFSTDGAQEPVVISIPRGSYVPVFEPRPAPQADPGATSSARTHFFRWSPWALVAILTAALGLQVVHRAEPFPPLGIQQAPSQALRDLWGQFFREQGQELTVVAADSSFVLWQNIRGQDLNLGDYLSRKYLDIEAADPKLHAIAVSRCTSPADVNVSLRLAEVTRSFGGRLKPQYARNLNTHDLRTGNAVLLGGRHSNPWIELFEEHMNFVSILTPHSFWRRFGNRSPRAGEPAFFGIPDLRGTEQKEMETYAVAALLPNLSGTGRVLILEGLGMEGTEAAGECVTNPQELEALLRQIGHKTGTPVPPFEAVIKLTSLPSGSYVNSKVVAFRYPAP
jgi:hypothetical protein